jgi:hypothetical protein
VCFGAEQLREAASLCGLWITMIKHMIEHV